MWWHCLTSVYCFARIWVNWVLGGPECDVCQLYSTFNSESCLKRRIYFVLTSKTQSTWQHQMPLCSVRKHLNLSLKVRRLVTVRTNKQIT